MATFKALIRPTKLRSDGSWNVKIRLSHNGGTVYIQTSLYAVRADLTRDYRLKNKSIIFACEEMITSWRGRLLRMEGWEGMTAKELAATLTRKGDGDHALPTFPDWVRAVAGRMTAEGRAGNAANYINALRAWEQHLGATRPRGLNAITPKDVREFMASFPAGSTCPRVYTAVLSAAYRKAMDEYNDPERGLMPVPRNPFAGVKQPKAPAPKPRALDLCDMVKIASLPDNHDRSRHGVLRDMARDMFILSYCLCGMNLADLYECSTFQEGRIVYNRRKTRTRRSDGAETSPKVLPAFALILERWRDPDGGRVLRLHKTYISCHSLHCAMQRGLRQVAEACGIAHLTFYAARHTFATLARNVCGMAVDDIARALNHTDQGHATTFIYLKPTNDAADRVQEAAVRLLFDAL